jgi:hypothetical protein
MSNQDYHEMLDDIVEADVRYVRAKDVQYDSSWKRHGGVGAFFTIVRPWDRLYNFAKNKSYDLFSAMADDSLHGPDGTALACVRDLRRYLLLLEAWIVWDRTRVSEKSAAWDRLRERIKSGQPLVVGMDLAETERRVMVRVGPTKFDVYTMVAAGMYGVLASEVTRAQREEAKHRCYVEMWSGDEHLPEPQGSPADGGHHEQRDSGDEMPDSVFPGIHAKLDPATDGNFELRSGGETTMLPPKLNRPVRLEDGLLSPEGDVLFIATTHPSGTIYFNVDRRALPADMIDHLPLLDLELNHKEWTLQRVEYVGMYEWDGQANKYRLRPEFHEAWGIKP